MIVRTCRRRLELCSSTRITQAGFAPILAFDLSFNMPNVGTLPANGEAWPIGRGDMSKK